MITIAQIKAAVADHYHLTPAELYGKRRWAYLAVPRQLAIAIAHDLTGKSAGDIGRAFDRDHTTVLTAINRTTARMQTDPELRAARSAIEAALDVPVLIFRHRPSGTSYAAQARTVEPLP